MHDRLLEDFSEQNDKIFSRQIYPSKLITEEFEHALDGLVSEVGELADIKKKIKFMGRQDRTRQTIIDEAGDCIFYIDRLLSSIGSSIAEAIECNIIKLKVRYGENGELKFREKKPDKEAEKVAQQLLLNKDMHNAWLKGTT